MRTLFQLGRPVIAVTRRSLFLAAAAALVQRSMWSSAYAPDVSSLAEHYVEEHRYNGVIAAGRGNTLSYARAFGLSNRETGRKSDLHTRFESGSISKWIAAIVVLHQVDRRVLSLEAPLSTYLSYFRRDNGSRITLADLMSHRSGVPNDIIAALRKDSATAEVELTQEEAVHRYASGDLTSKPGTVWDYSHSNWILVKAVLESATNRRYEDLAAELLWRPLRLNESGVFHGRSLAIEKMAQSYRRAEDGSLSLYPSIMPGYFNMAGGFYTTAPDMLRLMHAVASGAVLTARSRGQLFLTRVPENHYCLGGRMRQRTLRGRTEDVIWEDGSNKGFRMLAVRIRRTGETVIMTSNASPDEPAMGDFADKILLRITTS